MIQLNLVAKLKFLKLYPHSPTCSHCDGIYFRNQFSVFLYLCFNKNAQIHLS